MEIWEFVRLLLGRWIVRILFILGIASALAKFIPRLVFPYWVPYAVLDVALVVGSWDVFKKKQEEIERLRPAGASKPELVIYPQDGSRFYVRFDRNKAAGTYIHLDLIIANKGSRISIINRYELEIKEMGQSYPNLMVRPIVRIRGKSTEWDLGRSKWLMEGNIIKVEAGGSTDRGNLPLEVPGIPPEGAGTIHCKLTVFDDTGDQASCDLEVPGSW